MLVMVVLDRKSGSAGMPRPISYAVFCLKKKDFLGWIATKRGKYARKSFGYIFSTHTTTLALNTLSLHDALPISDKLVLTSVTPASSAPVLQTPKATSSTLYFDSLTVNAGNGGF